MNKHPEDFMQHIPVLLNDVLKTIEANNDMPLQSLAGKTVADCTFGAGGYSRAFLERGAKVIAFDRDPSVASAAKELSREYGGKFTFINRPFSELKDYIAPDTADAVVFDLGISSMQIDQAERGFSFRADAALDMRMESSGKTAAELIEQLKVDEIAKILRDYGDVKKAVPIARAIKERLPQTTFELRDLIFNPKDTAPVFQALRIAVNDELGEIKRALSVVPDLLKPGGICAVVTFHSLEDRLVKSIFREWTTVMGDPRMPSAATAPFKLLKAFVPNDAELAANPRARSAHLRAVAKI
ncbi:MAG: 16S rRNA (cytosine(1402)-N(4))-methyltransferase RsmH [Rickettsiales bacterium]|nr:16S rRNA (cytosine(1402)-N(4))-methyltransferase RsmH [Rickettsiales bacterium]